MIYMTYLDDLIKQYNQFSVQRQDYTNILTLFTYLRLISIAPWLLSISDASQGYLNQIPELTQWRDMINDVKFAGFDSEKIRINLFLINQILQENMKFMYENDENHKRGIFDQDKRLNQMVIFSSFDTVLELMISGIKFMYGANSNLFRKIDGKTKSRERRNILRSFRRGDFPILIANYGTAASGLNLFNANHVFLMEPWWTPAIHDQSISRVCRLGQTRLVHVYIIYMIGTIEMKIYEICEAKKTIQQSYRDDTIIAKKPPQLSYGELGKILQDAWNIAHNIISSTAVSPSYTPPTPISSTSSHSTATPTVPTSSYVVPTSSAPSYVAPSYTPPTPSPSYIPPTPLTTSSVPSPSYIHPTPLTTSSSYTRPTSYVPPTATGYTATTPVYTPAVPIKYQI
jgi:hypothetical protein